MIEAKDEIRHDRNALEMLLRNAGIVIKGKSLRCPFHDDKHASAGIYEKEGIWRLSCHSKGCEFNGDFYDVKSKLENTPVADLLRGQSQPRQTKKAAREYRDVVALEAMAHGLFPTIEGVYQYADPATKKVQLVVMRCRDKDGDKHFLQCRPTAVGFELGAPAKPWPIYNRARVSKSDWCFVVEGEKCVHAMHDVGFVATTSPGGAANARNADWSPLAGKTCYLWPDNDQAGRDYMRDVGQILEKLQPAANLRIIDPEAFDLPAKGDVCDLIEIWGEGDIEESKRVIESVIASAKGGGASNEVGSLIDETISGRRQAIAWPHEILSDFTQSLLPGTVTMICGNPGGGKSLFLTEAMGFWHRAGIPVALYALEHDRAYHLIRFLAQRAGQSKLTNARWVKENADDAKKIFEAFRQDIDSFGKSVFTAPDEMVSLRSLGDWVCKMADSGVRVIGVDPVTAAETTNAPWQDDKRFLIEAKCAMRRNGSSLIVVTHPRANQKFTPGLSSLAGGAAFSRFSQTVLWLHKLEKRKNTRLRRLDGREHSAEIQRIVKIY
ncbi:MAG: hypothetical protein WAN65_12630, partial [Candidatus Sulfotelmatobacter sp.]